MNAPKCANCYQDHAQGLFGLVLRCPDGTGYYVNPPRPAVPESEPPPKCESWIEEAVDVMRKLLADDPEFWRGFEPTAMRAALMSLRATPTEPSDPKPPNQEATVYTGAAIYEDAPAAYYTMPEWNVTQPDTVAPPHEHPQGKSPRLPEGVPVMFPDEHPTAPPHEHRCERCGEPKAMYRGKDGANICEDCSMKEHAPPPHEHRCERCWTAVEKGLGLHAGDCVCKCGAVSKWRERSWTNPAPSPSPVEAEAPSEARMRLKRVNGEGTRDYRLYLGMEKDVAEVLALLDQQDAEIRRLVEQGDKYYRNWKECMERNHAELSRNERVQLAVIDERDRREEQLEAVYRALGGEGEWSSELDLGTAAAELAARLRAQVENLLTPEEAHYHCYAAHQANTCAECDSVRAKLRRIAGGQP